MTVCLAPGLIRAGTPAALNRHERRVQGISPAQRKRLDRFRALSRASLDEVAAEASPQHVRAKMTEILQAGSLYVGSRKLDANGRAPIHEYLRRQIASLADHGVEYLGALRGTAAVPVTLDALLDPNARGPAAEVRVGARSWPVAPLWPNGAMPSLCPPGGLTGPLVCVAAADWADLEGLSLAGCIALMRFEGGRDIQRLFSLGCQAAIVMADDHVLRKKAERLFCNTPLPIPRFYVDAATGAELTAVAWRKDYAGGTGRVV